MKDPFAVGVQADSPAFSITGLGIPQEIWTCSADRTKEKQTLGLPIYRCFPAPVAFMRSASDLDDAGQSAQGALLELDRQFLSGLVHRLYDHVKADPVFVYLAQMLGEDGCIDRPQGTDGISLDTWDHDIAADRITGQSQVVLDAHFSRIFDLFAV